MHNFNNDIEHKKKQKTDYKIMPICIDNGLVQNMDSGLWTLDWTLDWTHGLDCGLRFGLDLD